MRVWVGVWRNASATRSTATTARAPAAKKASTTADAGSGDTKHEKIKLAPGERTVFVVDDLGKPYRLLTLGEDWQEPLAALKA